MDVTEAAHTSISWKIILLSWEIEEKSATGNDFKNEVNNKKYKVEKCIV